MTYNAQAGSDLGIWAARAPTHALFNRTLGLVVRSDTLNWLENEFIKYLCWKLMGPTSVDTYENCIVLQKTIIHNVFNVLVFHLSVTICWDYIP